MPPSVFFAVVVEADDDNGEERALLGVDALLFIRGGLAGRLGAVTGTGSSSPLAGETKREDSGEDAPEAELDSSSPLTSEADLDRNGRGSLEPLDGC